MSWELMSETVISLMKPILVNFKNFESSNVDEIDPDVLIIDSRNIRDYRLSAFLHLDFSFSGYFYYG